MKQKSCTIALDIGTGSTRAAVMSSAGQVLNIASSSYEQIVPAHGWSEQRPEQWWSAACQTLKSVSDYVRQHDLHAEAVVACGQMHGTVLVDDDGRSTLDAVPLWNDKRTVEYVEAFERSEPVRDWLAQTANPPTPAWPAFKLQWLRDNNAPAWDRASCVLMPKDYVNLQLTGERCMDWTDAACSFLVDPRSGQWSVHTLERLGLDAAMMPDIRLPTDVLGAVTADAARATGLAAGTPVLVGGGDYPMALLGSGVCRPGYASEVAGTSSIITLIAEKPVLDPAVCNVGTPEGHWGAFVLLESGGDAARWARRTFHDNTVSYADIIDQAESSPAGSHALFFLPYLVGERLGDHRNARAQFFGLSAGHTLPDMHRAVLEGVGFAANRCLHILQSATGSHPERLVASGGGAKADLWLRIKAAIYNRPIVVPEEPECGLTACAILAAVATGAASDVASAATALVRYEREVLPDPEWADRYARMQPVFDELYSNSQSLYHHLDALQ